MECDSNRIGDKVGLTGSFEKKLADAMKPKMKPASWRLLLAVALCCGPSMLALARERALGPGFSARAEPQNAEGQTRQAKLGVTMANLPGGPARVTAVVPGGPAEISGLRRGDVILAINGRRVRSYRDVIRIIKNYLPNDLMKIAVDRRGRRFEVAATLVSPRQLAEMRDRARQEVVGQSSGNQERR